MDRRNFLKGSLGSFGAILLPGTINKAMAAEQENTTLELVFSNELINDPDATFTVFYDDDCGSKKLVVKDIDGYKLSGKVDGRKSILFNVPFYEEFTKLFIIAIGFYESSYITVSSKLNKSGTKAYIMKFDGAPRGAIWNDTTSNQVLVWNGEDWINKHINQV